jgi:hypothetical protein
MMHGRQMLRDLFIAALLIYVVLLVYVMLIKFRK